MLDEHAEEKIIQKNVVGTRQNHLNELGNTDMKKENAVVLGILFTSVFWSVIVLIVEDMYRTEAINHKCAYYAPDTGDFTWMNQKKQS